MVAAVNDYSFKPYHRIACERAFLQTIQDSLLYSGNVVFRDSAADNLVFKFVGVAARQGFDFQHDVSVLAVAAALFFVFIFGAGTCGDALAVRHSGRIKVHSDAEFALHFFCRDSKLCVSHA